MATGKWRVLCALLGAVILAVWSQAQPPLQPEPPVEVRAIWREAQLKPGDTAVVAAVLDMDPGWHTWPDARQVLPVSDLLIVPTRVRLLGVIDPAGQSREVSALLETGAYQYPQAEDFQAFGLDLHIWKEQAVIYLPVRVNSSAELGAWELELSVEYQPCDEDECFYPTQVTRQARIQIQDGEPTGAVSIQHAALFASFDAGGFETVGLVDTDADYVAPTSLGLGFGFNTPSIAAAGSMLTVLLLAMLGGALMNVMPCVLPVIPIKVMGLVEASPKMSRRVALAVATALGVISFWIAIGLVVSLLSTAISSAFAFWWFNVALGLVIALLALTMFGSWTLRLPSWLALINPRHDSLLGAFGFGVMTGVLAMPCTGPVLGGVAGSFLQTGFITVLVVFTAIGVGMALPYFVLSLLPSALSWIPRAGHGGELVKQVMALLLLASGVFFVGVGINVISHDGTAEVYQWYWWPTAAVMAGAGLWLAWRSLRIAKTLPPRFVGPAVGLLITITATQLAYSATRPSGIAWLYYTPERLQASLEQGKAVVLHFTADWCINCKVLERAVLESEPIKQRLAKEDVVAIKADLSSRAAVGWDRLADLGRASIPLLVVYTPDGHEQMKASFYTAADLLEAIDLATPIDVGIFIDRSSHEP